jgi:hypothetical protein
VLSSELLAKSTLAEIEEGQRQLEALRDPRCSF